MTHMGPYTYMDRGLTALGHLCMRLCTESHSRTRTYTAVDTRKYTHAHTCTHTHTHTHTRYINEQRLDDVLPSNYFRKPLTPPPPLCFLSTFPTLVLYVSIILFFPIYELIFVSLIEPPFSPFLCRSFEFLRTYPVTLL
jgi:hypothetical protein